MFAHRFLHAVKFDEMKTETSTRGTVLLTIRGLNVQAINLCETDSTVVPQQTKSCVLRYQVSSLPTWTQRMCQFHLGSVQLRSAWMPLRLLYSHCHTSNRNVQGRTQCKCLVHTQKHLCESPSPKTTIRWFTPRLRHKLNGGWPDTESAHISSVPFSPTEESMVPLSSGHKLAKEEGPGALRFIQRFVP